MRHHTAVLGSAPTVVYIAGSGRSGSTLLERTLGAVPGLVNVGELIDLCRRVAPRNERCGCGRPFEDCAFWAAVGQKLAGGWDRELLAELSGLQRRVARQRHLPRVLLPPALSRTGSTEPPGFAADLARYAEVYGALYAAIADVSGARCVVDASKWPAQAAALARGGLDVRVVHLIRDPHGVAHSQSKQGIVRPHDVSGADQMSHLGVVEAAARWTTTQAEVAMLRTMGVPSATMRYADFVVDPAREVRSALTRLGLTLDPGDLDHVRGQDLALGASHGLSGNPSRFREGTIRLNADEAWRSSIGRRERVLVTTVAAPVLLAGALRRRASQAPGHGQLQPSSDRHGDDEWPLVSVIVPTRGRSELVRQTVRSVVCQTYPGDLECLVVHDHEQPDPALSDLGRPGRDVRVLESSRSPGLAAARNSGLGHARGRIIASCDDDDTWHPDKLTRQVERLRDQPDLLVVGSGIRLLLPAGKIAEWPGRADRVDRSLLLRNRVKELHSSTLVMRRDAFAKAGMYDEDLPHGYGEDYDWVLRASRVGRIGVVREPLADIRKDGGSYYVGRAGNAVEALTYLLDKHPEIARSRRGRARILGQIAFNRAALGQRRQAWQDVVRALRGWPLSPYAYLALVELTTGLGPDRLRRLVRLTGRGVA